MDSAVPGVAERDAFDGLRESGRDLQVRGFGWRGLGEELFELPAEDLAEFDGSLRGGVNHVGDGQPTAERPYFVGRVDDRHAQRRLGEQDSFRGLQGREVVGHDGAGRQARHSRLGLSHRRPERALERVEDASLRVLGLQLVELRLVGGGDLRQVGRGLGGRQVVLQVIDIKTVDDDHFRRVRGVGLDERSQTVGLHGPSTLPAGLVAGDARAAVIQVDDPQAGDGRDLFGLVGRPAGGRTRVRARRVRAHVGQARVRVHDQLRVTEQCEHTGFHGHGNTVYIQRTIRGLSSSHHLVHR